MADIVLARWLPSTGQRLCRCGQPPLNTGWIVEDERPIHASGHPARDEIRDMYEWIRPDAVPVHGEGHHLDAHAALAPSLRVPVQLNGRNGDLFLLAPQPGWRRGAAPVGRMVLRR